MANPEHLKILEQGVKAWNKWRETHRDVVPDLRYAQLKAADLDKANLYRVDLRGADLCDAKLIRARLGAADLRDAKLYGTKLAKTNLSKANLSGASLFRAHLYEANLSKADLSKANVGDANLSEAKLYKANINSASLASAVLFNANLKEAELTNANLQWCDLMHADLTGATLTGIMLYGSARDDWIIKDVKCDYVYWDEAGKQRSPKDRNLEPGEFERLYAALPTIEYIFEKGMAPLDPLIMDRVVQALREKRPEFDIKIDSINARGLAPSIKFTVQHEEHKEPALQQVRREYEIKLKQLESERDRYYQLLARALDAPKEVKLITAGPGAIVATDGSTINIQQHISYGLELQKAIAAEPEKSESFAKVAKKTALDIIGESIKDIAKGQVKEAAKQIIELGKDLGPIIAKTAAYAFFKSIGV